MLQETQMEVVRHVFDAVNRGDWDAAADPVDSQVEWLSLDQLAVPDFPPGLLRGKETLVDMWANFFSAWDEWEATLGTFTVGPDGRILVPVRLTAQGHGSGIPLTIDFFQVYTFRAEKILRIDNYPEAPEALKAARLSE